MNRRHALIALIAAGLLEGVTLWVPDWNTVLNELGADIDAYQKATG